MPVFTQHPHWGYLVIAALVGYFAFTGIVKKSLYTKSGIIKGKIAVIYGYFFGAGFIIMLILAFLK